MVAASSQRIYRALVIEDQDFMLHVLIDELQATLSRIGPCVVRGALTLNQALELIDEIDFDLILVDPGLPGFNPQSPKDRLSVIERVVHASRDAIHIVLTGFDTPDEGQACKALGAAAYVGKTGLDRDALGDILEDISESGFSMRLSAVSNRAPHFRYSELHPREQEILDIMLNRPKGMKRKDVYEMLAERDGVDADSVQKRYKRARAKLLKNGLSLPKDL